MNLKSFLFSPLNKAKHILASKTFWSNAALLALTHADIIPPNVAMYLVPAANIALRVLSTTPVTVITKPTDPVEPVVSKSSTASFLD